MTALPSPEYQNYYVLIGNQNSRCAPALQYARAQSMRPTEQWHDECQKFVRTCLNCPGGSLTAHAAWLSVPTDLQHTWYAPPAGVPVYWAGGTTGAGHAALADGEGNVWSTDIGGAGTVSLVPIGRIHTAWGLTYLGWTQECNGVTVFTPPN